MMFAMKERLAKVQTEHKQAYAEKVNRDDYTHEVREKPTRFKIVGDEATM